MQAKVTLLVSGESEHREFLVDADSQDLAAGQAISLLCSDWSIDDRVNAEIELVGVEFYPF